MDKQFSCLHHLAVENKIDALCKKMDIHITAINENIKLAKEEMERRLEGMNEFRAQLATQTSTFISRKEVELIIDKMQAHFDLLAGHNRDRIDTLDRNVGECTGAKRWSDHIITVLIAMATFIIAHFVMKF